MRMGRVGLCVVSLAMVSGITSGTIQWDYLPVGLPGLAYGAVAYNGSVFVFADYTWQYDIAAGTWTERTPPPGSIEAVAVALVGNKVYVVGGVLPIPLGYWIGNVLVYDIPTDTWAVGAGIPVDECYETARAVGGVIYASGRVISTSMPIPGLAVFTPATGSWTHTPPMPTPRYQVGLAAVDGKIYAIGGMSGPLPSGTVYQTVEIYDPAASTWTTGAPMPTARSLMATTEVNGRILVAGGHGAGYGLVDVVEVYNPGTDSWKTETNLPCLLGTVVPAASIGCKVYLPVALSFVFPPYCYTGPVGTLLMAGPLDVSWAIPSALTAGQWFTVTATVLNEGCGPAEEVTARLEASPPGLVSLVSGPVPSGTVTVDAGAGRLFVWTVSAAGAGTVQLTVSATGWDPDEGVVLTVTMTGTVEVQVPAALAGSLGATGSGCVGEQVTLSALVTNTGGAIARNVMPRFQDSNTSRVKSMEWAAKNRPAFMGSVVQAIGNEIQKHAQEQAAKSAGKSD